MIKGCHKGSPFEADDHSIEIRNEQAYSSFQMTLLLLLLPDESDLAYEKLHHVPSIPVVC